MYLDQNPAWALGVGGNCHSCFHQLLKHVRLFLKLEGHLLKYWTLILLVEKKASSGFHISSLPRKDAEAFPEWMGITVSCCFH